MGSTGSKQLAIALALIPIAGLVAWLATKISRTPEGDYRLLVIGGAIAFVTVVVAVPFVIRRSSR